MKQANKTFYLLLFLISSTIGFAQTITPVKTVTVAPGVCGALDVELKITGSNPVARPLEVVLVIDVSGSMGDGNNPKPLSYAQDAANDFIDKMFLAANNPTGNNKVAIVTFSNNGLIRQGLTGSAGKAGLKTIINGLVANGGTNIEDGILKANQVLATATYNCSTARSMVLLTDGVANASASHGTGCSGGQQGTCIQDAIAAANAGKTVVVGGVTYNNQIFTVGLFGAINGTEQTDAQYTLNQIQSGGSFFTENAADLTGIYSQIFTQLSWVAKQIVGTPFEKETVDPNFIIGTITSTKGTTTVTGQQIAWNIDFLNVETITLKYRLTPKPNTCGNQMVSTSRLDFQNALCVTTFQDITSPTTNVPCPIVTVASQTNVTCFGGNNGAITLNTPTGGQGPYTYKWTKNDVNFATTKDISGLTVGTYKVIATDNNNCATAILTINITQPAAALALAASSKTDATCNGASSGTVTAGAVTNSVGTVTYSWKNSSNAVVGTTASVSGLPTGTYTLTVTDSCSSQSNSVTVGQPASPLALAASSKTDASCNGASTGSVTAGAVTNFVGTVTYSWKNSSNVVVGTTASVTGLPAGIYTLTVTDSCSNKSNTVTIGQPAFPLTLAASSKTDASCYGASTGSVTAGAVTNSIGTVTYSWKNSSNIVVGTTASVTGLPTGTYTLTVTDSCSSQSNSVTIGQPSLPLALAASSKTDASCYGASSGSVTAGAVTNFVGTVTYSWKNSSNIVVGTTASITGLPTGTYTLTVTDSCSSQSNSVTIGQPSLPLALAASSKTDASCYGASSGSVTAGAVTNFVGTVTYSWKNSSNIVVGTTASVTGLPTGTYTLTVTDSCSSQSNSVTIGQPSLPLALAASSKTDASCYGASSGSVTAGAVTNFVGTVTYSWKNSSNVVVGTTASVTGLPTGTYTLTVTDSCSSQSNSVTIGQPSLPLALAASSKTDASCYGASSGSVTAGAVTNFVGTVTYSWKNSSNIVVGTTASVSGLPTGTYTLTVTDSCSSQSNSVTIGQPSLPLALAASSKTDASCNGASSGSVTAGAVTNFVGTVTYSWKNSSNTVVGTTASVTGLPTGTYTLTVTDSCSSQSNSVTIGQPSLPLALAASSKTDASCYGASSGSVTAGAVTNFVGTVTYSWVNSSNTIVGTTVSVTGLPTGTYTLTVTDSCSSQSNSVTIGQPTLPLALAASSKTDASCYGASSGSVTAGAVTNFVGTVTYSWVNSSNTIVGTTASVTGLPTGTYTLTVTDSCSSQSNSVTIGQPALPLALAASSKTDASCYGDSTGSVTAGTVTNAVGTVSYSWVNSSNAVVGTTASVNGLPTGTYTLTVTDSCSSQSNSVTIGQPSAPLSCSITQNKAVTSNGLSDGEATVSPLGGNGNYTYLWDNNETTQKAIALNAGLHSVTVTDSKGCTTTCTITISQPNVLSCSIVQDAPAKCYGDNNGIATVTAIGGNGDYTYLWDNNETTIQATALTAGLHTVTITDKLGYKTTCDVTIGQPQAALTAAINNKTDVNCKGDATGSATASATGGNGTYSYSWNTNPIQTSATANNLIAGTYIVTVTDEKGCTDTEQITITEPELALTAAIKTDTNVNCKGDATGSATASATGGTGSYSYSWNTNPIQTSATATNLIAGTYIVTVTDEKGCTDTEQITITEPELSLTAAIKTDTNVNCKGDATGSATASATGGTGTYSYSWNTNPIQTSATANNLIAGTYIVTVTDEKGCTDTEQITITEPELALTAAIKTDTNVNCKGDATGSATASATGGTGSYSYSWNTNPVQTSATASNLIAGTYIVTVTDEKGCTDTEQITITEPELALTAAIKTDTNVNCKGDATGSATASATGGTGAYSYSWNTNPIQTSATATNLIAGTYIVTVTDEKGCTDTEQITITEPELALTAAIKTDTNVNCKGDATGSATASATGGTGTYSYSWNTNPIQTSATANNLIAGTYIVTVTDEKGCTDTEQITITEPELALTAAIKTDSNVNCKGDATGSATASATGGTGTYSYSWNTNPIQTSATASNLIAGTYIVTVTDEKGCTDTEQITITEPELALTAAIKTDTNVNCKGDATGSATASATGGTGTYSYSWNTNPIQTSATASNLIAGTYIVTVTDEKGCTDTEQITISEPELALTAAIKTDTNINCKGDATGSATASATGGTGTYSYSWNTNPIQTSATANNLIAGTYIVTVTDEKGCTDTEQITITEPELSLTAAIKTDINVNCKGNATGSATASATGGTGTYSYSWNTNPIQTSATATNLIAGTYIVTVTDEKGCTDTEQITITEPELALTAAIKTDTNVNCKGDATGSATASATGGTGSYSYSWNTNPIQTSATANNLIAGTYIVTVTDEKGCTDTEQITITEPELALTATKSQVNASCGGAESGSATVVASGGTGPYTYSWNTNPVQTSATATNLLAGNYSVVITDSKGCTHTVSFEILDGDSVKPIIDPLPETSTINCPAEPVFAQATATDDNGTIASLTYEDTVTPGNCAGSYTKTRTWTAKDACGNVSLPVSQTIIVQDITAPTWSTEVASLNKTIECSNAEALSAAQALFPTATDTCDTDVTNIVKVSGQFVASETCSNAGTYTNTWTVKDDCGNTSDTFTQVITIQDTTAPTWSTEVASLNKTIECSNAEALTSAQALFPTATDACDTDVSNIVKVSGQFVANEGCANSGTYTNTWTVKDDCGNTSDTFTQVITIQDTTAPTWSTEVASLNKTIECSNAEALTSAQALFPTATDACDTDVSNIVKVSGQFVANEGCANSGTYTNTWTVKDDCGNTSDTFTQVITIQDTTAPTWTTETASLNKTIECSNAEALSSAQALFPVATDACDTDVTNIVKVSGQFVASETCSNAGTYTNTWTVKDDCGNTSDTFTQVITIQDTTAPIFAGELPGDITVSCDAVPAAANVEASDNCNGNLPIVFSEVKSDIQNECPTNYTLTRKWTTSDCGGNIASYTQIITVRDTTPPTGTAPSNVANLQSIADIPAGSPGDITDAADNCSPTVNITVSDSHNEASGCDGNAYILTRTYTLTDCAGNKTELVRTFTVDNKVSVSAVATNVSCLGAHDGSIAVTNSAGSIVIIRNANNEVVGSTNLAPGTYTVTATSAVNADNQTCTATTTVVITEPNYKIKISGQIINVDTNTPIANVPVTLIPQGTTTGPILLRITGADGRYTFTGMPAGSYLVQVQDANLNSAYQLYPVNSSLFFTTLEDCKFQEHNFEYGKSNLPVLGDYVWYDTNGNGVQDEWYDANNDGVVTKNVPDANGAIDYSLWEWIDLNGDGSYAGPQNVGELNAGGFGNATTPNVIIDGPNGYHAEVIVGIAGFWRNRPDSPNPYGDYNIKLVRDANLDAVAAALGATGLVKVIPSGGTNKNKTSKPAKIAMHTVCQTTSTAGYIVTVTAEDLVHLDADFGVNCKEYRDIVANDDNAGPFPGVNHTQTNVLNVLPNDTIEGVVVTPSDVIISTVTPNEFLQLNPDGSIDILPNAPAGTLTMVYQICEADQTSNCDTATVTITIEAPTMTVTATAICVNDVPYLDYVVTPGNFTPVNGVTIAWADAANNVVTTMTDLPLSGRVLWPGAVVDQAGNGIDWPGWVFQNNKWIQAPDGFEGLRPKANVTISVNPSQTITVDYPPADPFCTARPTFAILANDDSAGPLPAAIGGTNVVNVYTNDTLNGDPVNPADVTLTLVTPDPTGALTLNPDGSVDVKVGTLGGTYTLTYQICEKADNGNCDTAIVTVTVLDPAPPTPVDAVDDTYTVGCNTFGLVGNVLANDLKGNIPATLELVNFTLLSETGNQSKTDPNITIDASGNVTVSSLTPPGTYTYSYRICDKLSAENCDTATITITVSPNGVTNIASKACNDDRTPINLLALLPENTPQTGIWVDIDGSNSLQGNVLNAFGLAIGNYKFEYQITDANCPRSVLLNMEVNADCVVLACENIVIHNAFSPNGDGKNDVFVIDNIDETTCYPENTVEIYNRWGILVFETTNYNNTTNAFDGTSRGRTTVKQSDGLPTGTYFYVVTYKSLDGNNVVQNHKLDGYLYLSK